jgi:hypothetical protein
MKNKSNLGLAAKVLAGSMVLGSCGDKQEINRPYVQGTINDTEYSDNHANGNPYEIQGNVMVEGRKKATGRVDFYKENTDKDQGELSYTITPEEDAKIWSSFNSNKVALTGTEYIPTQIAFNGYAVNGVEITDSKLNAKLKSIVKERKKARRNDGNSAGGYGFTITEQEFQRIFAETIVDDQKILYLPKNKGNLVLIKENGQIEDIRESYPQGTLDEILIPLTDKTTYALGPKEGTLLICSPEIYMGVLPEKQKKRKIKNLGEPFKENTNIEFIKGPETKKDTIQQTKTKK